MNRRAAIRKAFGFGAAAAALPLLDKVVTANDNVIMCSPCGAPEWTPPPPDTRTPEQVLADQEQELVEDFVRHLTKNLEPWNRRYASTLGQREFKLVEAALIAEHRTVETRVINGALCLIGSNGNVIQQSLT